MGGEGWERLVREGRGGTDAETAAAGEDVASGELRLEGLEGAALGLGGLGGGGHFEWLGELG